MKLKSSQFSKKSGFTGFAEAVSEEGAVSPQSPFGVGKRRSHAFID
jgi:hypothetical protein